MNPARLVGLKDLCGGTKYLILSITVIHGDSSLVHLEGAEGDRVYTMWPFCPFDPEDVDGIDAGRIRCTMTGRGHQHSRVLSIILDKHDVVSE
jgi:hypothetical protein